MMVTAAIYAGIGIGTVFTVLIFISIIISCFKFIHAWELRRDINNKRVKTLPSAEILDIWEQTAPADTVAMEAYGIIDDIEMMIVLTAAIAAYENTAFQIKQTLPDGSHAPSGEVKVLSNGLVVRSIRRRPGYRRRW